MEIKTKKCNCCKEDKELIDFYIDSRGYVSYICRKCANEKTTQYNRTKEGLVTRIYSHQRDNCRKRNYEYPEYSLDELRSWCLSQDKYHVQFKIWEESNYGFKFTPSVDRLNDYKTYSLDNIQILSTIENIHKAHSDAKNGINNKMSKSIKQYDLDGNLIREFYSLKDAERVTGIRNGNISNCCSKRYKTSGGFVWRYSN